jgi:hypothetical protein
MSEEVKLNEGAVGPPEKPVFNPKQEILSKELIIEKAKKLGLKIIYLLGAGMKRSVFVKNPEGKELFRLPLTIVIILVLLSQFLLLPLGAVLVVYFKWKVGLESPRSSTQPPAAPPVAPPPAAPPVAEPEPPYAEPTLPPMPS